MDNGQGPGNVFNELTYAHLNVPRAPRVMPEHGLPDNVLEAILKYQTFSEQFLQAKIDNMQAAGEYLQNRTDESFQKVRHSMGQVEEGFANVWQSLSEFRRPLREWAPVGEEQTLARQ